jgi:formyltetrahydrofolate deformylase
LSDFVLTVACVSRRGIVAAVAGFLAENGCNITDSAQFDDQANGRFFMRVSFRSETGATATQLRDGFPAIAETFGMDWAIHEAEHRMRVLLMVSGFGHCLNDILYRWRIGALPIEIVGVVSNHLTYQKLVVNHDIPFHHIRVTPQTKPEAEARLMGLIDETGTELVVLARYMQVLSSEFLARYPAAIINIHHSFLPAFVGANPYQAAYTRGVKLIGATAHYVSEELDAGPIIEQAVQRVDHRHSPDDLRRLGRYIERVVLARAVEWHVEDRVLLHGNKTIVFA